MSPGKLLLSPREFADALGIGRDAAYALVNTGRVHSVEVGNRRYVPRWALEEFLHGGPAEDRPAGR